MLLSPKPLEDDPVLGRYLFKRKCPLTPRMTLGLILFIVGLGLVGFDLLSLYTGAGQSNLVVTVSGALVTLAAFQLIIANWSRQQWLHFHQRGIARVTNRPTRN